MTGYYNANDDLWQSYYECLRAIRERKVNGGPGWEPKVNSPFAGVPHKHYQVVYADPPWKFAAWSHRGEGKGASQHYDTMSLDDICKLPVADIATDNAALFLWVVQPMLPEGLRVVESWGFVFKTVAFVWIKMPMGWDERQLSMFETGNRLQPRLGLGYHTRSGAEQCWLAVRGKGYERMEQGIEQVLHAPLREHSRKPDEIARRIVALTGDVPRIELFARESRPGWGAWGAEREKFDGTAPSSLQFPL